MPIKLTFTGADHLDVHQQIHDYLEASLGVLSEDDDKSVMTREEVQTAQTPDKKPTPVKTRARRKTKKEKEAEEALEASRAAEEKKLKLFGTPAATNDDDVWEVVNHEGKPARFPDETKAKEVLLSYFQKAASLDDLDKMAAENNHLINKFPEKDQEEITKVLDESYVALNKAAEKAAGVQNQKEITDQDLLEAANDFVERVGMEPLETHVAQTYKVDYLTGVPKDKWREFYDWMVNYEAK